MNGPPNLSLAKSNLDEIIIVGESEGIALEGMFVVFSELQNSINYLARILVPRFNMEPLNL